MAEFRSVKYQAKLELDEDLVVRESKQSDLDAILLIEREAFNADQPVGYILFTNAVLDPTQPVQISILGPLAVIPKAQNAGIGGRLILEGFKRLAATDIELVFVLGHSSYYSRFGFSSALQMGFNPPFPLPEEFMDAWMAINLRPSRAVSCPETVIASDAFNHPHYWGQ